MKLKSKLIATIVSMCAAIAVMGVGVWASSSQSFQVTVKNDIDVKIISVDADVYGEFAVYSQFSGHTAFGETNAYAQAYHHTRTESVGSADTTFINRKNMDHGYLLYARGINGYNDGVDKDADHYDDADAEDYTDDWFYGNVEALEGSGYYKYVNEAKNDVYFATADSEGVQNDQEHSSDYDKDEKWAENRYNIDFNTHTAQIAYMYTLRQWKKASANAATNEIHMVLRSSISTDADLDLGPANDDSANSLTSALTNANGTAGVYIDAYITRATDTSNAANSPATGTANGAGALTGSYDWYRVSLNDATIIPESLYNETYYVVITYTLARTGANLDLSGLANAVEHQLVLTPPEKLAEADIVHGADGTVGVYDKDDANGDGYGMDYYYNVKDPTTNGTVKLCTATGLNTSVTGKEDTSSADYTNYYGKGYQIYGKEFVPGFSPAQITSSTTAAQLATCFAYNADEVNRPWLSNLLGISQDDSSASLIINQGYLFATSGDKNPTGTTGGGEYIPITATGTTGYFVKQLNDGNPVSVFYNADSVNG